MRIRQVLHREGEDDKLLICDGETQITIKQNPDGMVMIYNAAGELTAICHIDGYSNIVID